MFNKETTSAGCIFLIIISVTVASGRENEWVDHTDMLRYEPGSSLFRSNRRFLKPVENQLLKDSKTNRCCNPLVSVCRSLKMCCAGSKPKLESLTAEKAFIRRHVSRLLHLFENSDEADVRYNVKILLTSTDFEILRLYESSKGSIHDVDRVLSRMVTETDKRTWVKDVKESLLFQQWLTFFQKHMLHLTVILVICCLIYVTFTSSGMGILWKSFVIMILISIIWQWNYMLEIAEARKRTHRLRYRVLPKDCNPESVTYFESFLSWLTGKSDQCQEYHEAMIDSHFEVNPFKAAVTLLAEALPVIGSNFGSGFGKFYSFFMKEFTMLTNVLMVPIITIILAVFLWCIVHYSFTASKQAKLPMREMIQDVCDDRQQPRLSGQTQIIVHQCHRCMAFLGGDSSLITNSVDACKKSCPADHSSGDACHMHHQNTRLRETSDKSKQNDDDERCDASTNA